MAILTKISGTQISDASITAADIATNIAFSGSNIGIPSVTTANLPGVAGGTNASITATVGMLAYSTTENALMQYNGVWVVIAPPPKITSVSGLLNEDTDSTLTILGSNFTATTTVKMFDASAGGSQVGSNATTTLVNAGTLKAVFGGAGNPVAGNSVYIEVDTAGANSRFATAIVVNADPVGTFAGGSGASYAQSTHLGTYGGLAVGGPTESTTKLLLNFDRGGGIDVEDSSNRGGKGHEMATSGNSKIHASPFGDGKTAFRHTGANNQKINVAYGNDEEDFSFGSGDFCIDYWINYTSHLQNAVILGIGMPESASGTPLVISDWNADPWMKIELNDGAGGAAQYWQPLNGMPAGEIATGQWFHQAITKTGTTMRFFLNGALISTLTGSTITGGGNVSGSVPTTMIAPTANQAVTWGGGSGDFTSELNGYMDEMRIVKGETIFSAAGFTPSHYRYGHGSATHEATTASNVKLLLHSNRTTSSSSSSDFVDSSPSAHTVDNVSGVIHSTLGCCHAEDTIVTPALAWPASGMNFGSAGMYYDGSSDNLWIGDAANSPQSYGTTSDFTVDWWMRAVGTSHIAMWDFRAASHAALYFDQVSGTQVQFAGLGGSAVKFTPAGGVTDGDWHHVALVRDSTNSGGNGAKWYFFWDGLSLDPVLGNMTSNMAVNIVNGNNGGSLGGNYADSANYNGYINHFRVSTVARWTAPFNTDLPTALYGSAKSATLPTITFTGTASAGLAADEDMHFTSVANSTKPANKQHLTDSGIGLTLTNFPLSNAAKKNKAELTGTVAGSGLTSHSNMPIKVQVQKTITGTSYANASRTITVTSSTGLSPGMVVTGTGIPTNATIISVDTATAFTLSANPTGGTLTNQTLILLDPTRISHINGSDTLSNSDTMLAISGGLVGDPTLFGLRRYMGSGAAKRISGLGFRPDLVWTTARTTTHFNQLHDSVRGYAGGAIYSNDVAFDGTAIKVGMERDGFSLGAGTVNINTNAKPIIAWCWKAGGAPSANGKRITDGTETTFAAAASPANSLQYTTGFQYVKQSVNTAGQFSITKYQAKADTTPGPFLLPHGLTGSPDFFMVKSVSSANNWNTWHTNFANRSQGYNYLDLTSQVLNSTSIWGNTVPSPTHITLGDSGNVNYDGRQYILYAWKAVAGVSAFGTYAGDGQTTGAHVNLGFYPRLLMVKCTTHATDWLIWDSGRSGATTSENSMLPALFPNLPAPESSDVGYAVEWYETGGNKGWRPKTNDAGLNGTSRSYVYMAFA